MTKFEAEMTVRAVEALRRIADELSKIRSILQTKPVESATEAKGAAK